MTLYDSYRMNDNDWWYLAESTIYNLALVRGDLSGGSLGYASKNPLKSQMKENSFVLNDEEYKLLNPDNFNFKTKRGLKAWTHAWAVCAKNLRQRTSGYSSRGRGLAKALRKAAEMREKSNAVWMAVGPSGGVKTRVRGEWKAPTPLPSEEEWLAALPDGDSRKSKEEGLYNFRTATRWVNGERVKYTYNYWYHLEEMKHIKKASAWSSFSKGMFRLNRKIPIPDWEYINAFVQYDPDEKRVELDRKELEKHQKIVDNWNDPDFVEEYRLQQLGWAERNRDQTKAKLERSIETARRLKEALEDLS